MKIPYSINLRLDNVRKRYNVDINPHEAIACYKSGNGASTCGYHWFNAPNQKASLTIGNVAIDYGEWICNNFKLITN